MMSKVTIDYIINRCNNKIKRDLKRGKYMKDTVLWYSLAKPNPTTDDAQVQLGVHL